MSQPCPECPVITWEHIRASTDRDIRRQERALLRKIVEAEMASGDLEHLYLAMENLAGTSTDRRARRAAGLYLHLLRQALDQRDEQDAA